jgi:hypothetical protein
VENAFILITAIHSQRNNKSAQNSVTNVITQY